MKRVIAYVVCIFFCIGISCLKGAENLLLIGDFEYDRDNNGVPDGWAKRGVATSNVSYSMDTEVVHSGKKSLKMVFDSKRTESDEGYVVLRDKKMEFFERGRKYRLTGYVKGKEFKGNAVLSVSIYGENNVLLLTSADKVGLSGETDWLLLKTEFTVPANAIGVDVYTDTSGGIGGGIVWWDSISLYDITGEKEPEYAEKVIDSFENEESMKFWISSGALITRSDEYASDGKFSLKMDFKGSDTDTWPGVKRTLFFDKGEVDWTKYEYLAFDVYNPKTNPEYISLRIDDAEKKASFVSYVCVPGTWTNIKVKISTLTGINTSMIESVLFYMRMPRRDATLYLDNVRFLTIKEGEK
ncbi:MAG TPA: carbohydrate binding domain-containing protein [bacterium]|nr:carbohydrate binding domain-containing protein [bacterium]